MTSHSGMVREELMLPGWDPTDPIPAIAFHPEGARALPLVFLYHGFQGKKEVVESWALDIAAKGLFVVAPDHYLHGERSVEGIIRPGIGDLGDEYPIFIHQSCVAHGVHDFSPMVESLRGRPDVDASRIGVTGSSMGASLSMVLAWQEPRISAIAAIIGAADFWWDVTKTPPGPEQDEKKKAYGPRVTRLVDSLDPWPRLERIPPKALLIVNSREDPLVPIGIMRRVSAEIEKHYGSAPGRFRFTEETGPHKPSPAMKAAAADWLARFLG